MKNLKISALLMALVAIPAAATARESRPAPAMPGHGGMHSPRPGGPQVGGPRNWGPRHNGRWVGGWRAPGGWGAYRRPFVGYVLPRYWINPTFYLGNYSTYGFSRPAYGYGWSRYYDDAVLTDRYGRVQDYVEGVQWDRYDGYADGYGEDYSDSYGYRDEGNSRGYRGKDRNNGLGGALVGGAIGAIAGSAIAGRGDRTAGALIGGGLGAVAGAAVGSADRDGRDYGYGYGRDYRGKKIKHRKRGKIPYDYGSGPGGYDGQWNGRWTGSWNGGPTQSWEGTYEGSTPHWNQGYPGPGPVVHQGGSAPVIVHQGGYGYGYGGYGGEVTTIVVQSQPVVTTTTTTTEEVVYASATRKRYAARKPVKYRAKPRCVCKVVYR